jgi:protein gp37
MQAIGVKHYQGLLDHNGRWNGKVALAEHKLKEPLGWKTPQTVFVNSMGDLFHESVPSHWIDDVLYTIDLCNDMHTFVVLTKRPERMRDYMNRRNEEPLRNLALGVSVEDQRTADERIPLLLQTPARWRFVSYEPALGPVDFSSFVKAGYWYCAECDEEVSSKFVTHEEAHESCGCDCVWTPLLHGIIMGGESGPGARKMEYEWAKQTRDACAESGVNFFFKQWGEWDAFGDLTGKRRAGRLLDGREHNYLPWERAG